MKNEQRNQSTKPKQKLKWSMGFGLHLFRNLFLFVFFENMFAYNYYNTLEFDSILTNLS